MLRRITPNEVPGGERQAVGAETLRAAGEIVEDLRRDGEKALRRHAERLGDLSPGEALVRSREDFAAALASLPARDRELLQRTADRIRTFAEAQRAALSPVSVPIPGGRAGQSWEAVERAGCYAPGGRFPLPSSVLMTAVTARAAGVSEVWLASPRPTVATLAAAAVAGADGLLAVGGAQAIAALAYGAGELPACDVLVGPGNRWVTAAKQLVAGHVRIDFLAGPSELVLWADETADPALVAADLLAQAEHDPEALPVLVTTHAPLLDAVDEALAAQIGTLPTAETARAAIAGGFAVLAPDRDAARALCDRLAPEHLAVVTAQAEADARACRHYGALFIGGAAGEVLGDYGAGPNHVLPTGGTARSTGGLSVATFLRSRTWLRIDDRTAAGPLAEDAARLAELEGLAAHARAARRRLPCAASQSQAAGVCSPRSSRGTRGRDPRDTGVSQESKNPGFESAKRRSSL